MDLPPTARLGLQVFGFAKVAAEMVPLGLHLAFSVVISTVERESAARGVVCAA